MRMDAIIRSTEHKQLDRQALLQIYQDHSPGMYRYAYRMLGDQALAEDCVSDTFTRYLQLLRNGRQLDGNLQAYLYRMAHNWVVDSYRKQTPTQSLESDLHPAPDGNPEQDLHQQQDQQALRAALARLPYDQRMVIELRFIEDWSHDKVARTLGKTVDATRALQYRALESLRRLLKEEEE
jgi:RNA polymerase sigma-70 factor (ECF subfamily)